jgi:CRISPR-associated protein Cmr6
MWAAITRHDDPTKIDEQARGLWLQALEDARLPDDYTWAYERWERALVNDAETVWAFGCLDSRLLVGHGNATPADVGLTVQRTWGTPLIPGSALKGLLAHYVPVRYGPDTAAPDALERMPYRGVRWDERRPVAGPGSVFRALFGAPDVGENERGSQGALVFQDAWILPAGLGRTPVTPFAQDVLTVHQRGYYGQNAGEGAGPRVWPNDYESPVPVSFLGVRPGVEFLFAISGDREWATFAMALLKAALANWGVGGKTTSGYGRFTFEHNHPRELQLTQRARAAQAQRALEERLAAPPDRRWRELVDEHSDADVLEWVRLLFEVAGDKRRTAVDVLVRECAAFASVPLDAEAEANGLLGAICEAGLPARWKRDQVRGDRRQVALGQDKLKARARLVEKCAVERGLACSGPSR